MILISIESLRKPEPKRDEVRDMRRQLDTLLNSETLRKRSVVPGINEI
jgi:hypothetical protein